MNRLNPRTVSSLIVAVIVAALLGFGAIGTQANAPSQPSTQTPVSTASSANASSTSASSVNASHSSAGKTYTFRSNKLLNEHYNKHGIAMGFADAQAYVAAANAVINNPDVLHKLEAEDGDDVYYLEATDEIVFISTDGYIRTYFNPGGIGYFNRQ